MKPTCTCALLKNFKALETKLQISSTLTVTGIKGNLRLICKFKRKRYWSISFLCKKGVQLCIVLAQFWRTRLKFPAYMVSKITFTPYLKTVHDRNWPPSLQKDSSSVHAEGIVLALRKKCKIRRKIISSRSHGLDFFYPHSFYTNI